MGLGASVCAAETIPDSMLYHAAVALSQMTSDDELGHGRVFPPITNIRDASQHVAVTVAKHAAELNIARERPARNETVEEWMQRKMYYPEYSTCPSTPPTSPERERVSRACGIVRAACCCGQRWPSSLFVGDFPPR